MDGRRSEEQNTDDTEATPIIQQAPLQRTELQVKTRDTDNAIAPNDEDDGPSSTVLDNANVTAPSVLENQVVFSQKRNENMPID